MLTCWKDTGIETVEDFRGKTIGVWFFGNEYPFLSWMSQVGIPTEGGEDGVTVLKQGPDFKSALAQTGSAVNNDSFKDVENIW